MDIAIEKSSVKRNLSTIAITGSKSESNRLLLLKALYPSIQIDNLSKSDDSELMQKALASSDDIIDIHHAGTAMRFLTAYFAIQKGRDVVLTGSSRMKERPIKILVDALRHLGADIEYIENDGFPPLRIKGKKLTEHKVSLEANVSSQYISALLLIASKFKNGLELTLEGSITSVPYIKMTLSLLSQIGVETAFSHNTIRVLSTALIEKPIHCVVESDWSSASYFYSIIALSQLGTELSITSFKQNSLQGDAVLSKLFQNFGVVTEFHNNAIRLRKVDMPTDIHLNFDLSNAPDIAQTIAVVAFGLGLECNLTGLHTLKIKETDRLVALKTELEKLGAHVCITADSLHLIEGSDLNQNIAIDTYNDHRMAMAFAPLAIKVSLALIMLR